MNPHAPRKTLADYLVVAVSPVLIMLLVGSLSFFLIQVFYRGALAGNVRWVVFWFVVAVVLVARIGIEQGSGHATVYGLALAAATWLYLVWLHPAYVLGIVLLAVIWWCANKLTRDCTLIDEDQDASGRGLLQAPGSQDGAVKPEQSPDPVVKKTTRKPGSQKTMERRAPPPHPPGLWVVYFSLAALPLFGIGQMLVRDTDSVSRRAGLTMLFVYLTAALGLLLTTSFLGLRRYLRQRFLVMPPTVAFGWIRFGVGLGIVVLVGALLVPRPGAQETWTGLRYQMDYQLRRASEFAARMGGHGQGEGRPGNDTGESKAEGGQGSTGRPGEERGQARTSQRLTPTSPDEKASAEGSPTHEPSPGSSAAAGRWYALFRFLLILGTIVVFGWWLLRRRHLVFQIVRSFIEALIQFFWSLFSFPARSRRRSDEGRAGAAVKRPTFARFENPFLTGRDRSWTPEEVILYSYEALRAWAEERGVQPRPQQTAREFCIELAGRLPEVDAELSRLSFLYAHAAYGVSLPAQCNLEPVRRLWRYLTASMAATVP